jgi:hypothetical protein
VEQIRRENGIDLRRDPRVHLMKPLGLLLSTATVGPIPITGGEKPPDRVEHGLMMVRLRDRRPVFANIAGFCHGSRNGARENDLDMRIILAYPGL